MGGVQNKEARHSEGKRPGQTRGPGAGRGQATAEEAWAGTQVRVRGQGPPSSGCEDRARGGSSWPFLSWSAQPGGRTRHATAVRSVQLQDFGQIKASG